MYHRIEISPLPHRPDPRGEAVRGQVQKFLGIPVQRVATRDVYSIFADIDETQAQQAALEFSHPILQRAVVGESDRVDFDWLIIVGFLPGVTDNVGRTARAALRDVLGRPLRENEQVYSSIEYLLSGPELRQGDAETIAFEVLANPLIQSITVLARLDWKLNGIPVNRPEHQLEDGAADEALTEAINLDRDDDALARLSRDRTLALSLTEMKAIQAYFQARTAARAEQGLPEQPTDVELEVLAQTWSEHCKHKIFDARIAYIDETDGSREQIDSCFKTYIVRSTDELQEQADWLVSVFKDNAGIIRFNDDLNLVYKVETHNSPSALDPYGGAMTGIVGVNRDSMGTGIGAELLLNVWGYCFSSPFTRKQDVPEGLFHPRRLRDCVHQGVIEGGNQSGIPYGVGWEFFDPRYLGKPLVFCGTVGVMPRVINEQPSHEKQVLPGDLAVMAGGRIGKDGIHGATFSSEELHQGSPAQAVQIGDPITQKRLYDFMLEARDRGLFRFIHDMGAGGISSSIGEMAQECGGCRLDLAKAPVKYPGLKPWEILLSEAQERMSFAVPPESIDEFVALSRTRDVEVTVLGEFTDSGDFHIQYGDTTVARLELAFMDKGYPRLELTARWRPPVHEEPVPLDDDSLDIRAALAAMLRRVNIGSGEELARSYDHEVKGLSVIKPYVGVCNDVPSDAVVSMVRPRSTEGIVVSAGIAPRYSDIDTYHMAASVIDMAVRRIIAVGGELGHIAGLDNFCWPDPVQGPKTPDGEYKLAQLVRANKALYDYTKAFGVPCISGKDSMKNDSTRGGKKISIPPTLLFSALARMPDITRAVTLDVKRTGDLVYVLGETHAELGGSEYYAMLGYTGNSVPTVDAASATALYTAVSAATARGLCRSLHTPAIGGLAIALARMAIGGRLGMDIDLAAVPGRAELTIADLLFSETNSRFIATVHADDQEDFEALLAEHPCGLVGRVKYEPQLTFYDDGALSAEVTIADLRSAFAAAFVSGETAAAPNARPRTERTIKLP
jgi:phosphoribosylformylglycinamidine synthase